VLTADFSTTGHSPSGTAGNVGTEIKNGDDTRSLIGMVRTNSSAQFQDDPQNRFVLNWFNRGLIHLVGQFTADRTSNASTVLVEVSSEIHINFICWADEALEIGLNAVWSVGAASTSIVAIGVDSLSSPFQQVSQVPGAGGWTMATTMALPTRLSEGFHYATVLAANNTPYSLTFTYSDGASRGATRLWAMLRG
jgi:hypothetical protein